MPVLCLQNMFHLVIRKLELAQFFFGPRDFFTSHVNTHVCTVIYSFKTPNYVCHRRVEVGGDFRLFY